MDIKDYLKDYENKIIICYAEEGNFPRWSQEREKYIYKGEIGSENMRELLPDEVLIEFDRKPDCEFKDSLIREEAIYWMVKIKNVLESYKIRFHITDHSGKSPHLRLRILGLDKFETRLQHLYKRSFAEDVLSTIKFNSSLVVLDESFFSGHKLIPLEEKPHFKKKYHTSEIIIYDNSFSYMRVSEEKMKQVEKSAQKPFSNSTSSHSFGLDLEKMKQSFAAHYVEGRRHYILVGWTTLMQKKGYDCQEIKDIFTKISQGLETQEGYSDYRDIDTECSVEIPIENKSVVNMFEIAYGDNDSALECYYDFIGCFAIGDDL